MDWDNVELYLDTLIKAYKEIGMAGVFALSLTIMPLKRRFDAGERSDELYKAIMECE